MGSVLLTLLLVAMSGYWCWCWGADWARKQADRLAQADAQRAIARLNDLRRKLEQLDREGGFRASSRHGERAQLVAAIARAERDAEDAKAILRNTGYHVLNWDHLMPWVDYLTLGERLDDLRARRRARRTALGKGETDGK